jgi:hypothetical protein
MSQGFRLRKNCLGFALVALAIHAITPDSHDLTSFSISRILQSFLADSLPTTDATAPLGEDTPDEKADEVYVPPSAGAHIAMRRPTKGSPRQTSHAEFDCERSVHAGFLHALRPFGGIARTGELILVLCRLTC